MLPGSSTLIPASTQPFRLTRVSLSLTDPGMNLPTAWGLSDKGLEKWSRPCFLAADTLLLPSGRGFAALFPPSLRGPGAVQVLVLAPHLAHLGALLGIQRVPEAASPLCGATRGSLTPGAGVGVGEPIPKLGTYYLN